MYYFNGVSLMINIYISKSDSILPVDWDSMPKAAQDHIIEYGLKQKLNDAGSSATVKELGPDAGPQALAMAENVLSALMKGEVTVRKAASNLSTEDQFISKVTKAIYKSLFKKTLEDGQDGLALISEKLGKPLEKVTKAIEEKAQAEYLVWKQIQALKSDLPSIDL